MRPISVKIPRGVQNFIFFVLLLSLCSGVAFYIFSHWITIDGDFGPEKHPLQYPMLQLHGAAAFLMMMIFGAMLAAHVPHSWKLKRSRGMGMTMITVMTFQVLSAYILYYLAGEEARPWFVNMHAAVGLSIPFVLITHIVRGRKNRSKAALRGSL